MILRKPISSDWKYLLDWRNDPLTRKNTASDSIVTKEQHLKWFHEKVLSSNDLHLFLAEENKIAIGTIRFETKTNRKPKVSWTIAPEFRNQGLGRKMVELFQTEILQDFCVEIKQEDVFSTRIAEKLNFVLEKEDDEKKYFRSR